MIWLYWLYYLLLFALLLCGLALTVMTLPGLWLMLAGAGGYAWATRGQYIGWKTLLFLFVIAAVAEVIEFTSSGTGAKKAGGGKGGMWGALLGAVIGGIVLSIALSFIPILGTLVGVCIGTFLGAMLGELIAGRELGKSAWVGVGAAKGRLFGTFIKLGFGCVMLVVILAIGIPIGRHQAIAGPIAPPTRTLPATTAPTTR